MTNNFEKIKPFLNFDDENIFYLIQILRRNKENEGKKNTRKGVFYIYSFEDLDNLQEKIIASCEKYNARAYINVNRSNLKKIALYTQKIIIDLIIKNNFKDVEHAYSSACNKYTSEPNMRWIIDIDKNELAYKDHIICIINDLHHKITKKEHVILGEIPSKSGIHLISNTFDVSEFNTRLKVLGIKVDVKKDSPTILYTL